MNMTDIKTHMVFLGTDMTDPDKPILESKTGRLDVQENNILKIKNALYQVRRVRTKTKKQSDISLTMQFIYVMPISQQAVLAKIKAELL